jgi:hypothetical protein
MFLTNWLMVTRIVAASVIEAVDYPTPEEFFLAFDGTNTLFMYGGSKDTSSTSNVAIYYDGYKHETGNAYPVVLSEPGEYKALVDVCGTRYLTSNVTVGAVSPVLSSGTLAFHHGNFDDVYGDGDVATAAANGHVYADTPTGTYSWGTLTANTTTSTNTTYEWTPLTDLTADVLMVAGGGGGGGVIGGGGGAGGLLYHTNQNLSGTKTIVVGNGGIGGIGFFNAASEVGTNGTNTSFTGFDNAIGGGRGGANYVKNGNNGGSGGGGTYDGTGGSGTSLQGNAGGGGGDDGDNAGGGGGSGGTGGDIDVTNDISGNGGIGTNLISTFGILYGDGGYFASGGGGGARTGGTAGTASQGGGTNGTSSSTAADDAQKHTGGGGGGAGYDGSSNSRLGGDGGSGIVLLSYQYSTDQLSYNNYNKLTVANTSNANVETNLRLGANTWDIATASNIWICKPGDYKSFTVDPDAQTAYFGNVTVGTVTEEYIAFEATSDGLTSSPNFPNSVSWINNRLYNVGTANLDWVSARGRTTIMAINKDTIGGIQFKFSDSGDYWNLQILTESDTDTWMSDSTTDAILSNEKTFFAFQNGTAQVFTWNGSGFTGGTSRTYTAGDNLKLYIDSSGDVICKVNDIEAYNITSSYHASNANFYIVFGSSTNDETRREGYLYDFNYIDPNGETLPQPPGVTYDTDTLAFHHGNFDATDYGGINANVEAAAAAGFFYANTPAGDYLNIITLDNVSSTTNETIYEIKPMGVTLTSNVLMVAGGGGGAGGMGGGGGAGGLVFTPNVIINDTKVITVGNGGVGGRGYGETNSVLRDGTSGTNTSFTGLTEAVGGGGAGGIGNNGKDGGSGGGAGRSGLTAGVGTINQGNNGGTGPNGGGGGGAGGVGGTSTSSTVGNGGAGLEFISNFTTLYGDQGYFASGGGGGTLNAGSGGTAPLGGGSDGVNDEIAIAQPAKKHTGGGGGGSGSNDEMTITQGGSGGSGIVLIKGVINVPPASLTYDTYNKLTVTGQKDRTLYKDSNSWSLGTASDVYIADPGEYIYFTRVPALNYAFLANVVVGSVSVDLTLSETSIVKQFIYDENGYTDARFSEASETQSIRLSSDGLAMALGDGNYNSNDGRLYYYERSSISDTFTKTHTFDAVSSGLEFGASVDMNAAKTRIAISGSDADNSAANAGRVYIYDRASTSASWPSSPTATITPPASTIKRFGHTVNMSDDGLTMITSGDGNSSTANESGVYVYEYASGSWSKTFQVTRGISRFGFKVAMNKTGTRFIAGGTGTAYYVYHKVSGTWSSTAALTGATGYHCGMSPDGNTVAVGIVQYSSNLGRVAVYKYSGGSWGSATNIDTTVGSGIYSFGNTPVFNNDGTLLVTGCLGYNSYMGCFEMWKYESGSWVFKNQFLNPTVKTGHGNDTGEFFGGYLSMDYAGTSLIVSNTGNDVAGDDYGRVVLYGAGSLPSLTYDGLNSLKVTGAETSSYITYKAYESNKFLACGTDLTTYPLSKTGNYKAEIAGSSTFTLTSNVLVPATNIVPLYQYPPTDGTTSGVTETVTADENSIWTVSGAGYGNGLYHAQASVAATSTSVTAYHAFDNNLTAGFETISSTIGTLRVQLPSAETVHKYVVWPKAADGNRPKSWIIEGSQDAATWTTIHTVTDSPPSLSGDIHEISSPAAYVYYRINVSANNGGTGLEIAELVLWGDVAFSITFSDGWVTTNGATNVTLGSSYTLPTYTSSLPVTVTGASDFDVNTTGTYVVVYTSVDINELVRRVVRRFVVA